MTEHVNAQIMEAHKCLKGKPKRKGRFDKLAW